MTPTDYINGAATTTPPMLHHASMTQAVIANGLQAVADAANNLNFVKKTLVYGQEKRPFPEDSPLHFGSYSDDRPADVRDMPPEVLHGIVGMLTEGGELAELALTVMVGQDVPFDRANLREELGDQFWYIARILKRMQELHPDENWTFEAIMAENLAKLDVRHKKPGEATGFNADAGSEAGRDREAEKAAAAAASARPEKPMERRLWELEQQVATASSPGNYDANQYMHGMANGLILANATIRDEEPAFLEWPEGKPVETDMDNKANLGLATNEELETELRVRKELGHTDPNYRTVDASPEVQRQMNYRGDELGEKQPAAEPTQHVHAGDGDSAD